MNKIFFGDIKDSPNNDGLLRYCYDESKSIEDRMSYLIDLVLNNKLTAYYYRHNGRCVNTSLCTAKIKHDSLNKIKKVYKSTIYEFEEVLFLSSIKDYNMDFGEITSMKIVVSDNDDRYKGVLLTLNMALTPPKNNMPLGVRFIIWRDIHENGKN